MLIGYINIGVAELLILNDDRQDLERVLFKQYIVYLFYCENYNVQNLSYRINRFYSHVLHFVS